MGSKAGKLTAEGHIYLIPLGLALPRAESVLPESQTTWLFPQSRQGADLAVPKSRAVRPVPHCRRLVRRPLGRSDNFSLYAEYGLLGFNHQADSSERKLFPKPTRKPKFSAMVCPVSARLPRVPRPTPSRIRGE